MHCVAKTFKAPWQIYVHTFPQFNSERIREKILKISPQLPKL